MPRDDGGGASLRGGSSPPVAQRRWRGHRSGAGHVRGLENGAEVARCGWSHAQPGSSRWPPSFLGESTLVERRALLHPPRRCGRALSAGPSAASVDPAALPFPATTRFFQRPIAAPFKPRVTHPPPPPLTFSCLPALAPSMARSGPRMAAPAKAPPRASRHERGGNVATMRPAPAAGAVRLPPPFASPLPPPPPEAAPLVMCPFLTAQGWGGGCLHRPSSPSRRSLVWHTPTRRGRR